MSVAVHFPIPPELDATEIDPRSIHAFHHGYPSELVRWHYHDDYEVHLIVSSVGKMFVGDFIGNFGPGQLILTGPRLPHNWISQTSAGESIDVRDMVVQFRQDLIRSFADSARELGALLPLLERSRYGIEFYGGICADAQPWFERIIAADDASRIGLLIEFLSRLERVDDYRLLSTLPMRAEADLLNLDKIERVTNFITNNYAKNITLAGAAALVGMNESAFSRFFTRSTGNNFSRFLNRVRIARACELLSTTDEPITSICFAVGYNNIANFNRRFRELKSISPREYRKHIQLRHQPVAPVRTTSR